MPDRLADFDYELPPERIAQAPADRRDESRLLEVGRDGVRDRRFRDVVDLIPANAVVVINDTRVVPARLRGRKASGGAVELLLLDPAATAPDGARPVANCLARASKPLRSGARIVLEPPPGRAAPGPAPELVVAAARRADGTIDVELPGAAAALCEAWGDVPLPPYIERSAGTTAADRERYQTVYARAPGAVAAPTAGLHLTPELLAALAGRGVAVARLTLHVGAGTFAPVRDDDLDHHVMHAERYDIPAETAALVASGRPLVAVGTTVVRALESAALPEGRGVAAGAGQTRLFIRPGFGFRVVDHMITNFHLPRSTLLMLVCAFGGRARLLAAYRHAVAAGYRFYSYGDAMWLDREARDGGAAGA